MSHHVHTEEEHSRKSNAGGQQEGSWKKTRVSENTTKGSGVR